MRFSWGQRGVKKIAVVCGWGSGRGEVGRVTRRLMYNFKIKCVVAVPYPYVGREGILFIPHDILTYIWWKYS